MTPTEEKELREMIQDLQSIGNSIDRLSRRIRIDRTKTAYAVLDDCVLRLEDFLARHTKEKEE